MKDTRELIRRELQRPPQGVTPADASSKTPAKDDKGVDPKMTTETATTAGRLRMFEGGTNLSNVFADFRRFIPSAGANFFGRIIQWIELRGFVESAAVPPNQAGTFRVNPRDGNNHIIRCAQASIIVFPGVYEEGFPEKALVDLSTIERDMYGYGRRGRVQPHTLWIFHNGFAVTAMPNVIFADGEAVPVEVAGVTVMTVVHVTGPGTPERWRVLGAKHFAS